MNTTDDVCIRWNNFQENTTNIFMTMRKNSDYTDVTLVCGDGHQVEAHKAILAASSPFFNKLLNRSRYVNPFIYMIGMNSDNLEALLDFIYHGETNIHQDNLEIFLNIAQELGLGLVERSFEMREERQFIPFPGFKKKIKGQLYLERQNTNYQSHDNSANQLEVICNKRISIPDENMAMAQQAEVGNNFHSTLNSIMTKVGDSWNCTVCGKISSTKPNLKKHVESMHTDGFEHACPRYEKIFRYR